VLIVAENASAAAGGEAALPLMYFRLLRERGANVHLLVHERTREELLAMFPTERERIHFVTDKRAQVWLWKLSDRMPARLGQLTCGWLIQHITQLAQRDIARRLVREHGIAVVHQPTPVSPRMPSMMHDLGAPVVIGPMNGGMSFPPAFRGRERAWTRWFIAGLRRLSSSLHALIPGKRRAALLLVANERTRQALPRSLRSHALRFCENGVDFKLWHSQAAHAEGGATSQANHCQTIRMAFAGRLVDLKGVDLLLEAVARAKRRLRDDQALELNIIGDGERTSALQEQAALLKLNGSVRWHGWQSQAKCASLLASMDALVMPSLCECGGAVVLEAMALGLPVIASKWGGPADYLDRSCGVLVPPDSRDGFVKGLEDAMVRLVTSPELRRSMGDAGREKAQRQFDWHVRIERMIELYHEAVARSRRPSAWR